MKAFEIFRTGRHTAMSGTTLDFSEDALKAAVAAYDPALHEAPIVVGHPKTDAPAYGWIKALTYAEGVITVEPAQVEEQFAELVEKGRFKKRSASWYLPDSPNNPKPGTLYLKHVGFLGAVPPALKGLKDVAFADDDAETIEFADRWVWSTLGSVMRNLREWFIAEKDMETADRLVPAYAITELENASRQPENPNPPYTTAFSEDSTMDLNQAKARITELETANATLTTENTSLKTQVGQSASFAERETSLTNRETAVAARELAADKATITDRVEKLVKAGKILPAQKAGMIDFAMGLADKDATIDFGEGDKKAKVTQREHYLRQLEAGPKVVDYTEVSAPDGSTPGSNAKTPEQLADRARELVAEGEKAGKHISYTEAVAHATAETTAE